MKPKPDAQTQLRINRTFRAPREQVFRAWTDPRLLKKWWRAAEGFTTPITEVDLRIGGSYRLGMKPPDREEVYTVSGVYREIVPPEKLVYTWQWEAGGHETLVTVEFKEQGEHTEVVLIHEQFVSTEDREEHLAGWGGCLDALAPVVEGQGE